MVEQEVEGGGNNGPGPGEVTAAVITMRVLWSSGAPTPSMKGGCSAPVSPCQPAPTTFLIWKTFQWNSTAGQPQVVAPMSTYIFITSLNVTENCQLRAKPRPDLASFYRGQISLSPNLSFENARYNQPRVKIRQGDWCCHTISKQQITT